MTVDIRIGDARDLVRKMPDQSVQMVLTSPPYYGLRRYTKSTLEIGIEPTIGAYVDELVSLFRAIYRVLKDDGTVWLNLGDSYVSNNSGQVVDKRKYGKKKGNEVTARRPPKPVGLDAKQLIGIPWRVALALQADGWYLRRDIIWDKPNPSVESVLDRCTSAHEYLFHLSKSPVYYYDAEAIKEPMLDASIARYSYAFGGLKNETLKASGEKPTAIVGDRDSKNGMRNKRSVWTVLVRPYPDAHFATMPPELARPCILAGSRPGDTVLDPFGGAGTTGMVAAQTGRNAILLELSKTYGVLARQRIDRDSARPDFFRTRTPPRL